MIPIQGHFPDTLWPQGRINNVVCRDDTNWIVKYVPFIEGCSTGYQEFTYKLIK